MQAIGVKPDYVISVRNPKFPKRFGSDQEMNDYDLRQRPIEGANHLLEIEQGE